MLLAATTSINICTLASFTSNVSCMFRRKVVRVCAIPLGVIYICPVPSFKEYMVLSALRISSAVLHLLYQQRYCHQEFSVAFCCAVAQFLLLDGLKQVEFGRCSPVSAIDHTRIRINGSPSYSGTFGARLVHVGTVDVFSFYRGGPTTLLGQKYPFSCCSCPHRVLRPFSVITALSVFHSPRPLHIFGRSIDIRRHTAR